MNRTLVLLLLFSLWIVSTMAAGTLDHPGAQPETRTVYPAPYSQNFNDSFPPSGWEAPSYGIPEYGFFYEFVQRYSQACARMWSSVAGYSLELFSPQISIPENATYRLSFKWSHGQMPDYNYDYGSVYVFDANDNSTKVWERFGTAFNSNDGYYFDANGSVPGSGISESIDLGRWAGQTIQVKFMSTAGFGPDWYIDDFSVYYEDSTISSFPHTQSFASNSFPPTYWSVPNPWEAPTLNPWTRSNSNAYAASGTGSALCSFENCLAGRKLDMITPYLNLGAYGGFLSFDYAYSAYLSPNAAETLDIEYATNYGNSFQPLASYNAGNGGGLVTAAPHSGGQWAPGAADWASHTLVIPPGTRMLRFRGTSAYNGRLFVDNIRFEKRYFPSGDGTAANPYLVSNASELSLIRNYLGSAANCTYFKLNADIDMTAYLAPGGEGYAAWGTNGWLPIGSSSTPFYGILDGDGHSISNLRTAYYGGYHGLFGYTAAGSSIQNLGLASSCYILGDNDTGSISGKNLGSIMNCSSAAEVRIGNAQRGGGICGDNMGIVSNCTFTGIVSRSGTGVSSHALGGIVGKNETIGSVTNCSASTTISGSLWNGGIAGWNDGTISRCASFGTLSCNDNSNGGLVGQNAGNINNSYSRVNVTGAHFIGGLVGNHGSGIITNCYSTGTVSGGTRGGLTGNGSATVTSSYWDTQSSGIATSFGGTGKTTLQMQTQVTYTGWDFGGETANGTSDYWYMTSEDNGGYPFLLWEKAGELRAPILVTPADLATGMPVSGFELSWTPNPVGMAPTSYNVYLMRFTSGGIMEEHLYPTTATTFNPVTQSGIPMEYEATWYWTVEAVSGALITRRLPLRSFQMESDPLIDTFPTVETFVGNAFPPQYWSNTGWERHDVNAYGASGNGSARAYFYGLDIGAVVDLVTKPIDNHGLEGILSFDCAYTPDGTRMDLLEIWYSLDNGATYSLLQTYTGGVDGTLVTTPQIDSDFIPSASQWATISLAFPAGTNFIRFRGISAHGNNLYLDNITFESLAPLAPAHVNFEITIWDEYMGTWDASVGATWYGIYAGTDPNNLVYQGYTYHRQIYGEVSGRRNLFFRISAGNGVPVGIDRTWNWSY